VLTLPGTFIFAEAMAIGKCYFKPMCLILEGDMPVLSGLSQHPATLLRITAKSLLAHKFLSFKLVDWAIP
jgi:hypothetical protein